MGKNLNNDFDVIIVGGGMVGASLACALADTSLRIAIIEAAPFKLDDSVFQPAFDARSVALAHVSKTIFESMGLWQSINQLGVSPIKHIHVSDRGHAGVTRLNSEDEGIEALGYVVETRVLGKALFSALLKQKNVQLFAPATFRSFNVEESEVNITLEHDGITRQLSSRLLVAADGGDSVVRRTSGMDVFSKEYAQSAVIANIATDRPHQYNAFERFTDTGPVALLPMSATTDDTSNDQSHRYSLVWTVNSDDVEEVMGWNDEFFLQQLQSRFGSRAGNFVRTSTRYVYPLSLMRTREHVRPRLAVIGNAAHTLHPVAGQGFNLGLRDVAALSQVIVDAMQNGDDIGDISVLDTYADWRKRDQLQTSVATDGLVRIFSSNFLPVAAMRNAGLLAVDLFPPLKKLLTRHAMGFVGKLPRLARGLKL